MNIDRVEVEKMNRADAVVMQVSPVSQGWSVTKVEGTRRTKSLTDFKTKEEALCYAMALAETESRAVVEVYDENGLLEARSAYWTAKNVHSGMGQR